MFVLVGLSLIAPRQLRFVAFQTYPSHMASIGLPYYCQFQATTSRLLDLITAYNYSRCFKLTEGGEISV